MAMLNNQRVISSAIHSYLRNKLPTFFGFRAAVRQVSAKWQTQPMQSMHQRQAKRLA